MMNAKTKTPGPRDGSRRVAEDLLALTAGLGAGAGLMYLCDPHRGRERRNRLTARAASLLHRDEHRLEKRAKNVLNRVHGFVAEVSSALAPEEQVPDEVLVERVRSRMGHVLRNPQEIEVHAKNGIVILEGKLSHAERRALRDEVAAIPGVRRVNDRLRPRPVFPQGLLVGIAAGLTLLSRGKTS